jgi:hypothetical protein
MRTFFTGSTTTAIRWNSFKKRILVVSEAMKACIYISLSSLLLFNSLAHLQNRKWGMLQVTARLQSSSCRLLCSPVLSGRPMTFPSVL